MKRPAFVLRRIWAVLCAISLLTACANASAPSARGAGGSAPSAAALIVDVGGDAALKRQGWQEYAPATFGAAVRRGDLVKVGDGRALIACSDLNLAEITSGVKGYPCAAEGPAPLVFEGALVSPTRGDQGAGEYPVVLAPRKTRIVNDRPLLRWTAVPGATSYRVRIEGAAWETEVLGATEIAYPADAPALEAGKSYRLVVETQGRSSNEEATPDLGFTLLSPAEGQSVQADAARARSLGLSDEATRLLVANLYAGHQLYAEALQALEGANSSGRPALSRLEGDLSLAVGLVRNAETAYARALGVSAATGDREGEALASRGLARVYGLIGNAQEATRHYQQARDLYKGLGDRQAVAEIDAALK